MVDQHGVGDDGLVDNWDWVDGVHHRRGHVGLVDDRGSDDGLGDERGRVHNRDGLDDRGVVDGNDRGVVGHDGVLHDRGVVNHVAVSGEEEIG